MNTRIIFPASGGVSNPKYKGEKKEKEPRIERADQLLVSEIQEATDLMIEPTRDHFDYVYRSENLIGLAGRKYHSKRNHISKFERSHSFTYAPLSDDHVKGCLELAEGWCEFRRCEEDMNLLDEWEAVREGLKHFGAFRIKGGVILVENKVESASFMIWNMDQTRFVDVKLEEIDIDPQELLRRMMEEGREGREE